MKKYYTFLESLKSIVLYRGTPLQNVKIFHTNQYSRDIYISKKVIKATNYMHYAAVWTWNFIEIDENSTAKLSIEEDHSDFIISKDLKPKVMLPCSIYIVDPKSFKKTTFFGEWESIVPVKVINEIKYSTALEAMLKNKVFIKWI